MPSQMPTAYGKTHKGTGLLGLAEPGMIPSGVMAEWMSCQHSSRRVTLSWGGRVHYRRVTTGRCRCRALGQKHVALFGGVRRHADSSVRISDSGFQKAGSLCHQCRHDDRKSKAQGPGAYLLGQTRIGSNKRGFQNKTGSKKVQYVVAQYS